jgi:hypothetical protein
MVNRNIVLWGDYNKIEVIDKLDDFDFYSNNRLTVELCETRKKLNDHPLVEFVDLPAFMTFYMDLENKMQSNSYFVKDYRTKDIFEIINDPKNINKRFYIYPPNKNEVYYPLPTVYDPHTFKAIKNYCVRMKIVDIIPPEMGVEFGVKKPKTQTINNDYMYILIRR